MPKTREMTFVEATANLKEADKILQDAAKTGDRVKIREAAIGFTIADRDARSAKSRENSDAVSGILK